MLQAEKFKAEGNFETLMLMDHLSAQKTPELMAIFKHCRTSAAFGPRNQTHAWQPIDRGHLGPPELPFHQAPSPILLIDLSELPFHQAPSPISVIDLSVLLFHQAPCPILPFHQAPSPILGSDLVLNYIYYIL